MSAPFLPDLGRERAAHIGLTVLMSMKIFPALKPASIPSGLRR